jgi:hypothetical protein
MLITWAFPLVAMAMLQRLKGDAEFTEAPVSQLRDPSQEHNQLSARLRGDTFLLCIFSRQVTRT